MNDPRQRRRAINQLIRDKVELDRMSPEDIRRYSGARQAARYDRKRYDGSQVEEI